MSSSVAIPSSPAAPSGSLTVALAGNPNSGKTTIFNALTGLRQKVANYPGVTVEKKTGRFRLDGGRWVQVIDLPGTYSLVSRSPDELVAMAVLRGLRPDTPAPDVVVVVVDASNLQRNLYLVSQLIELGRPLVVALNMVDIAERRGIHVSAEALEAELGVPVVPVVGHKRRGIAELRSAIARARVAPMPDWPLPPPMKQELAAIGGAIDSLAAAPAQGPRAGANAQTVAERLLIGDAVGDVAHLAMRPPVAALVSAARQRLQNAGIDPMQADIEAHYRWIEDVARKATASVDELAAMGAPAPADDFTSRPPALARPRPLSDRIDAVLVHKFWGLLIFAIIMGSLFVALFWLADPIMTAIEDAVGAVGGQVAALLPAGPLSDLVNDGIFAGVGAVIVFVPQIALLFLFLAILEDSGYLARAAFLMDRLLAKVGLHGKSFIPLLSSFACAIPGILATRTIEDRRDRLATIFVAPFMSCSARLPVYTLLIGLFFAGYGALAQAAIMLGLYTLGIVAAAATAWVFKRSLLKGPTSAFILEMPSYKVPQAGEVLRQVWLNTREFITRAGTIIFCLSVVLWAISYYPRLPAEREGQIAAQVAATAEQGAAGEPADAASADVDALIQRAIRSAQGEYSIAGRFGHALEPLIRPLGYDWKMGVGLIGAFAAREVFISTMSIIYSVQDTEEDTSNLRWAMREDRYADGRPVWTPLVGVSLLVWFVLAMQCMSTLAVVRRETGSWRWPLAMLLYMNALAYLVCLGIYQVGARVLG